MCVSVGLSFARVAHTCTDTRVHRYHHLYINYYTPPAHAWCQTLNLILLTASELEGLRLLLRDSFSSSKSAPAREAFVTLFKSWCHNPVATFRLRFACRRWAANETDSLWNGGGLMRVSD